MDTYWTLVGGVSAFANRIAEAVKASVKLYWVEPEVPVEKRRYHLIVSLIALVVSLIAGVLGALVLNLNFFLLLPDNPYTTNVSPLAGILVSGAIASLGSEFLQWFTDLVSAARSRIQVPVQTKTSVIVETKSTVPPSSGEVRDDVIASISENLRRGAG